jgi:hypothetical protein
MRGGRAAKKNDILTVYECVQRVGKTSRSCASFFIDTAFISFRIITTESLQRVVFAPTKLGILHIYGSFDPLHFLPRSNTLLGTLGTFTSLLRLTNTIL